ncbi:M14 family metallopeptidase [Gemmatimonadota bacterium]
MALKRERHRRNQMRGLSLAAGLLLLSPGFQGSGTEGYHTYDEMTASLRSLVRDHSDIATMTSLGKTLEGRDIWVVEIANRSGVPVDERPALLLAATLEGDHLVGSELAVHTVEYLLTNYATDPEAKDRIDNHVFYVFPRVNPDAAELRFADVLSDRRTNAKPYDGDNDGRVDEDGPEDLNGDGLITLMRVADATGKFLTHPDDPRLLKPAEAFKGESGRYKLYWEGIDNDGDGFYNEDGLGGVDINRNFQHEYPHYEADAGLHMVSELESRALMDFVLSHRNIAMTLNFGESDNLASSLTSSGAMAPSAPISLWEWAGESFSAADTIGTFPERRPRRGFGSRGQGGDEAQGSRVRPGDRVPSTTVNNSDLEYYKAIGERYREITGVEHVASTRAPKGAFYDYAYYQYGVPSFSTTGWGVPASADEGEDERSGAGSRPERGRRDEAPDAAADLSVLQWMDAEGIDGFVDWVAFQHPTLGAVELGGFRPYAVNNPPASQLAALGESHAEFAVYLASLFARVSIASTEVTNHGGGVFEIEAEIENTGYLPTATAQGVISRSVKPTMVQLDVPPEDFLTGAAKTSFFQALEGSGARQTYTWVIRGREGARVELKVQSQKGGSDTATITLR